MSAFEDSYTTRQGPTWIIQDHPSFEEHINHLATSLSSHSTDKSHFIESYRSRAAPLTPPDLLPPTVDDDQDDDDGDKQPAPLAQPVKETDEDRGKKWDIVNELVDVAEKQGIRGGEGGDSDLVSLTSLVISLLSTLSPSPQSYLSSLLSWSAALTLPSPQLDLLSSRFTSLVHLYNSVPTPSSSNDSESANTQVELFLRLVRLAFASSEYSVLDAALGTLTLRAREWRERGVKEERTDEVVKEVVEGLIKGGKDQLALNILLSYLSPTSISPPLSTSPTLLQHLLLLTFRLPSFLSFTSLSSIPSLSSKTPSSSSNTIPQSYLLLLKTLQSGTVSSLKSSSFADIDVDSSVLLRKIRLLAIADLAAGRVGGKLSYGEVEKVLELGTEGGQDEEERAIEVETWVIDVNRSNLISARLHEPTRTILVSRATAREVKPEDWSELRRKLERVRKGIEGIAGAVGQGLAQGQQGQSQQGIETGAGVGQGQAQQQAIAA